MLHNSTVIDERITGYARVLNRSNGKHPRVFLAVQNNVGPGGIWLVGYIHYGGKYKSANRELAARLVLAVPETPHEAPDRYGAKQNVLRVNGQAYVKITFPWFFTLPSSVMLAPSTP